MNTMGHYRCEHCAFRSFTIAGLNTHVGKKHPDERHYGVWSHPWRGHLRRVRECAP